MFASQVGLEHLRRACWRLFRTAAQSDQSRAFGPSRALAWWWMSGAFGKSGRCSADAPYRSVLPLCRAPHTPTELCQAGGPPLYQRWTYRPHKRLGWIAAILATGGEVACPILLHWGVGPRAGGLRSCAFVHPLCGFRTNRPYFRTTALGDHASRGAATFWRRRPSP